MAERPKEGALVTGAGKRIGRVLALDLAANGYRVAVHYNSSATAAESVVNEIKSKGGVAAAVKANLSVEKETASLIANCTKEIGALSILVNSASVFEHDDIDSMTRASWDRHVETNLRAPVKLIQDFAAQAEKGANNLVINILDQRVLKLTPQFFSYTVSKAALHTITKTLAQALGPQGIRVNAIGPGPVLKNDRQSEEDWQRQNEATILGRGALPNDISEALSYLISAKSVTGHMIPVDGGQHLAWKTQDVLVKE